LANYNQSNKYNDQMSSFYNSAPRLILILENGTGVDLLALSASLQLQDSGIAVDQLLSILVSLTVSESGVGADVVPFINFTVTDSGIGNDLQSIVANFTVQETGVGMEVPRVAKTFYLIDGDNVLQPLGVIVLNGRDGNLLPELRDYVEEIPGRHGNVVFGSSYKANVIELRVANSTDPAVREQLKRTLAKWLNPMRGTQPLTFSEDLNKTYYVRYAGKIPLEQWPNYMEFVIPLKMTDPIIVGSFEQVKIGGATLTNEGNIKSPLTVEVEGLVTNPSWTVGGTTYSYTGTVPSGQKLVVDTSKLTAELNGINALANYSGGFPFLPPGNTLAVAGSQVTFRWRSRWIG